MIKLILLLSLLIRITTCNQVEQCGAKYFQCPESGKCVYKYMFCDGKVHCIGNSSDEKQYNSSEHESKGIACRNTEYVNRVCFLPKAQADRGGDICRKDPECREDEFKCKKTNKCIPRNRFCDGVDDCDGDGSDEISYNLSEHGGAGIPCRTWEYINNVCLLPNDQAHKNESMCSSGEECLNVEFKCRKSQKCIYKYSFCDFENDCDSDDESDEMLYNETAPLGVQCRSLIFTDRVCVLPPDQKSKEQQLCRKVPYCSMNEFKCKSNGRCIDVNNINNGKEDCEDGSDEGQRNASCSKDWFECSTTKKCIYFTQLCDGTDNCGDGSDEIRFNNSTQHVGMGIGCQNTKFTRFVCLLPFNQSHKAERLCSKKGCKKDEFTCQVTGKCIHHRSFCDGAHNCERDDTSEERVHNKSVLGNSGIACRSREYLHEFCVLPHDQVFLEKLLCKKDGECDITQFQCERRGNCIPRQFLCDGKKDCGDGSDERKYDENSYDPRDGTICRNWKYTKQICILPTSQSHKQSTLCSSECSDSQYECPGDGECLSAWSFCNGKDQCNDDSDEILYESGHIINGIQCRNLYNLNNLCVLPQEQAHKNQSLCKRNDTCDEDEFECETVRECITKELFCNGFEDCSDGSDEKEGNVTDDDQGNSSCRNKKLINNVCLLPNSQELKRDSFCLEEANCDGENFRCENGKCIYKELFCNGIDDCGDSSDERSFSNETDGGMKCSKNSKYCLLPDVYICDGIFHCGDGKDEQFCMDGVIFDTVYSDKNNFKCLIGDEIIRADQLCDNLFDCLDMTDECLCTEKKSQDEKIVEICELIFKIDEPTFNKTTICETRIHSLNGTEKFCLENEDYDLDEEGDCNGLPSHKNDEDIKNIYQEECSSSCLLRPEYCQFIYIRIPDCILPNGYLTADMINNGRDDCEEKNDEIDYREEELLKGIFKCSPNDDKDDSLNSKQICDGIRDCADGKDEKYCDPFRFYCDRSDDTNIPLRQKCDLRKDCPNAADELDCQDNQRCSEVLNEDGNITEECEKTHFYCDRTTFIDSRKLCDGNEDCGEDECQNCTNAIFSDDNSLISSIPLLPFLWAISLIAVIGNIVIIGNTIHIFATRTQKMSTVQKSHNVMILNLACADLLVGIYTLAISAQNVNLSRNKYCHFDQQWRSSGACSFLGVLLMTGSEESVLILTIITLVRLRAIYQPFKRVSIRLLLIVMGLSWFVSLALATIPLLESTKEYFIERIWYSDNSYVSFIDREDVPELSRRLMKYFAKYEQQESMGDWDSIEKLIQELNPTYIPARRFGYYSTHGVCLPRLFPNQKEDAAWAYSLAIILINFIAFIIIFFGYLAIYIRTSNPKIKTSNAVRNTAKLQGKVTRIVITDMLCWIPVAVLAFLQLSGIDINDDVYVPVGMILIPINSSVNPFMYSETPVWLSKKIDVILSWLRARHCCKKPDSNGQTLDNNLTKQSLRDSTSHPTFSRDQHGPSNLQETE